MKKNVIIFALLLSVVFPLRAQDTLYSDQPPANYHVGCNWPQFEDSLAYYGCFGASPNLVTERGLSCITDTQLTVYGLATSIGTYRSIPQLHDTYLLCVQDTETLIYEYFRLYQIVSDTQFVPISGNAKWQDLVTPVAYYLNTGLMDKWGGQLPVFPVYELYFQEPVTVNDTFYMGHTITFGEELNPHVEGENGIMISDRNLSLVWFGFMPASNKPGWSIPMIPVEEIWHSARRPGWTRSGFYMTQVYYYLFPILTPNPNPTPEDTTGGSPVDTTGVGPVDTGSVTIDTLSIGSMELVNRYTTVFPNPAHGTTRVLSSFGLTRVEAYTVDGRKVHEETPKAYTADIDVSQWPVGEYLLRITTRHGTVTRKLLVR